MEEMIHVLKVTANAQDANGANAEVRHSLIVFVKCEDEARPTRRPTPTYDKRDGKTSSW